MTRISLIGGVALALAASPAMAGQLPPLLTASGQIDDAFLPVDTTSSAATGFATVSVNAAQNPPEDVAGGFALASFGALYVSAHGGPDSFGLGYDPVETSAAFIDPLAIRSFVAGRSTRRATVALTFRIAGTLSGGSGSSIYGASGSSSTLDWSVGLYDGTDLIGGLDGAYKFTLTPGPGPFSTPTTVYSGDLPGVYSFAVPAASVLGRPLSLVASIGCATKGLGDCEATHSFHWGGITLVDPDGRVTRTVVDSGSGTNYAHALSGFSTTPEPASWALLIAGFGAVGAAARRRRSVPA